MHKSVFITKMNVHLCHIKVYTFIIYIVYTFVRHESELPKDIFIRCAHLVKKRYFMLRII